MQPNPPAEISAIRVYLRQCSPQIQVLCDEALFLPEFRTSPGGKTRHHAYEGGLMQHTLEVVAECWRMTNELSQETRDIVLTAAVFHDVGKIHEYRVQPKMVNIYLHDQPEKHVCSYAGPQKEIVSTPFRERIGHVAWSWHYFLVTAKPYKFSDEFLDQVSHCMLSHHGRLEWRSPVEPQTREAFILHQADMLSMLAGSKH